MTKGAKGTILITTLWILALLTLLALGIGIRMGIDVKLTGFYINSLKARYLAEAGIRKTIALLDEDDSPNADSLNEIWSCGFDFDEEEYALKDIGLGEGGFTVFHTAGYDDEGNPVYLYGASDEGGRLNINEIKSELLARLPGFSFETAFAVLDWRDEDELERPGGGAEDAYYESLEAPYECRDGRFGVPEELMLVKGVTQETYDGVKDLITVYGQDKAVNINTASEGVLAVIAGEEFESLPAKIARYRNGSDGLPGTEDDKVFVSVDTIAAELSAALILDGIEQKRVKELADSGFFKVRSDTFRVVSRGELKDGRIKKTIEAVIRRGDKGAELLYYYED